MAVSIEELKKYIKSILKDADLTKLSSKMIRRRCEEEFETDLTSQKQEIDKIIMTCINENSDKRTESADGSGSSESSESSSEESQNEVIIPDAIPEKKIKRPSHEKTSSKVVKKKNVTPKQKKTATTSDSDNDAAVARKLQEEEWNFRRRSAKRTVTKKSAAKTKKTNESGDKPKVQKGNSSYTRKCLLSEELAAVMDTNEMARHDVVKKMWSIVRERNLLDPANKQFALCDDQLQKLFGKRRIRMFGMMKYLKTHVKDLN